MNAHPAHFWRVSGLAALSGLFLCTLAVAAQAAVQVPAVTATASAPLRPQVVLTPELRQTVDKALAGDAQAESDIGMMFYSGNSLPKSDVQAVKWFQLSAAQGNSDGAYNLGLMYINGRGVAPDDALAVKWLTASAMKGHSEAQLMLGMIRSAGLNGSPVDEVSAIAWTELAAAQGNPRAQALLDLSAYQLSPENRQAADDMAQQLHGQIIPSLSTGQVVQPADLPAAK